jgi:hypothetical protein
MAAGGSPYLGVCMPVLHAGLVTATVHTLVQTAQIDAGRKVVQYGVITCVAAE